MLERNKDLKEIEFLVNNILSTLERKNITDIGIINRLECIKEILKDGGYLND